MTIIAICDEMVAMNDHPTVLDSRPEFFLQPIGDEQHWNMIFKAREKTPVEVKLTDSGVEVGCASFGLKLQ